MSDVLKLLRYNTGTDKKAFILYKDSFDAVIFNATIVAYSGAAVADLVSVYQHKYIIDPQTHIFQHDTSAIKTYNKKSGSLEIKKSVMKYLEQMPDELTAAIIEEKMLTHEMLLQYKTELCKSVLDFQTEFINGFIHDKEYSKYLEFVKLGPEPRLLIAPYFMIKKNYNSEDTKKWFKLNKEMLQEFRRHDISSYETSAQLVIHREVLLSDNLIQYVKDTYTGDLCKYIFLWIEDFNTFIASDFERNVFYELLEVLNKNGIKPIMSYGGFDSIFLCNKNIKNRLYGVAQSVGYGEQREITPIGGGMPVNKYYFPPTHERLKFGEVAEILRRHGYFDNTKSPEAMAVEFHKAICDCTTCREVMSNNIDNFEIYNESTPFITSKGVKRNRPTTDASFIAAKHFLECKIKEWELSQSLTLAQLKDKFIKDIQQYDPKRLESFTNWCEVYAK